MCSNDNSDVFNNIDADLNHFNEIYPDLNDINKNQYYDSKKFNELKIKNDDFKLFHHNARSLNKNFDQLTAFLSTFKTKFDVLCFTESWLHDSNKKLFHFHNYKSYHSLRPEGIRGGGISIFISNKINNVTKINHLSQSNDVIESLFLDFHIKSKRFVLGTIYKPTKTRYDIFSNKLVEIISSLSLKSKDECIILGDFNIDLLKCSFNDDSQYFLNCMNSLSFIPLISKPTRITDTSATLIDNIFTNNPIDFISGNILTPISDHYPNFLIRRNIFCINSNIPLRHIQYRLINDETIENFRNEIDSHDFSDICNCRNVSSALDKLTKIINYCYNSCCPIRQKYLSYKSFSKPWITKSILFNIKKRQNYLILYRQNKITKHEFIKFRNYVTNQIRSAKKEYFKLKFNQYVADSKNTWRIINNILKPNHTNNNNIKKLIINDKTYEDNKEISNEFNTFFTNIGKNIAESLPNEGDHNVYMRGDYPNSFYFTPVNFIDVDIVIASLKNKTFGIDTIPVKMLKVIRTTISPILAKLVNFSLSSGEFPKSLKTARVTPIFKGGSKCDVNNYRPISVLPLFSKIFEKIVYKQIYQYLESNDILFKNQFGFRRKKSTTHAFINQLQYLYNNIDKNNFVFSLFLDFRKAFDSVDHNIMLSKLYFYGFRGNVHNWFKSYLSNRKQFTSINSHNSDPLKVTHGVPQGSILGPLLFLIFINDLPNVSSLFKFLLFADDSTLSTNFSENEIPLIKCKINNEMKLLNDWLISNKISINATKTKYIIFSYRVKKELNLGELTIGNTKISETDNIKFLGIFLDSRLKFNIHVNYLSSKISKQVGLLYKLNNYLPKEILKILYNSFVCPYINYGIEVWFSSYLNNTNKISVLQKKSIRAINNLPYNDHTNDYFLNMNLLKLKDLFNHKIALIMFKTLNFSENPDLLEALTKFSDVHTHFTRNLSTFRVPKFNKKQSKFCIENQGVTVWNSLPLDLKNIKSLNKFKKQLKLYYLSKYSDSL